MNRRLALGRLMNRRLALGRLMNQPLRRETRRYADEFRRQTRQKLLAIPRHATIVAITQKVR
jgi:hypothetical protein